MRSAETNHDPQRLALRVLAWTLAEPDRALRLLDVTGLEPAGLRARADDPAVLAAALAFVEAHEPDLIACAETLGLRPQDIVAAHAALDPDAGA